MNQTLEVVIFKTKPGVSADALTAASRAVTPVLAALPGFVSRRFGRSADGEFVDIVCWQTLTQAKQAAEAVMAMPVCGAFFALIDPQTVQLRHLSCTD